MLKKIWFKRSSTCFRKGHWQTRLSSPGSKVSDCKWYPVLLHSQWDTSPFLVRHSRQERTSSPGIKMCLAGKGDLPHLQCTQFIHCAPCSPAFFFSSTELACQSGRHILLCLYHRACMLQWNLEIHAMVLKISETSKAHISATEADTNKRFVFVLHVSQ